MKELIVYQEEDGTWIATCDKIPGYTAKGRTEQDAIFNMKRALAVYFPCGDCKGSEESK